MTERKKVDLEGLPAPALGVEERSDEAPSSGVGTPPARPDTEAVAKPSRRRFTAEYRLRILEEAERCTGTGEVGQMLRREGLYSLPSPTGARRETREPFAACVQRNAVRNLRPVTCGIPNSANSKRRSLASRRACTRHTSSWAFRKSCRSAGTQA